VGLSEVESRRIAKAGLMAAEQLKLAKQIVSDGGFSSPTVAPLLIAAVLQAIAMNHRH
jgi:hypothetical protein